VSAPVRRRAGLAVAGCGAILLAALSAAPHRPRLLWNTTRSAPLGLYRVAAAAPVKAGDWVVARPPPALAGWFARRGYLPSGVPLVKRVAAVAGDRVCRRGDLVTVDGRPAARALERDHRGRVLPVWRGCVALQVGEVFLLNAAADSLDGRYFGVSRASDVVGRATPLWTWESAP